MNFLNNEVESKCRLCLGDFPCISLFNTATASQYRREINICTGLEIIENEKFPPSICKKCALELPLVYNFVVRCRESDKKLRFKRETAPQQEIVHADIAIKECSEEDLSNDPNNREFISQKLCVLKTKLTDDKPHLNKFQSKRNFRIKELRYKQNKTAPQCSTCGLETASVNALEIHSRTHTGERPYICIHCGKSFAIKSTLNEHVYRLHTRSEKSCTCENCGKQFICYKDLKIHMRIHTGEKPYKCPSCNLSFTQHGTVVRHIRTHTGEKPFPCKICGKHFSGQSVRNSHMRSHSDERPFQCETCEKHFKSRSALMKHHKLHTGLRENICDLCGATFSTKGSLVVHIKKVHSKKSGVCTVCNKHFSDLKSHLPSHGGVAPYQCPMCSRRCLRKCALAVHLKKHFAAGKFVVKSKNVVKQLQ